MATREASPRRCASTTSWTRTLGKAIPYGVYDVTNNQGWVSVGIDHDTAEFAADSIRRWWHEMGGAPLPAAPASC